jgi:type IV secretion system protein VirD4
MSGRKQLQRSPRAWAVGTGLGSTGIGWLLADAPAATPGQRYWPWFILLGLAVLAVLVTAAWRRHSGSAGLVRWWSWRSQRNAGVASRWMILRRASRWAMRRKATVLRPSLRELSWWRRWFVPTTEYATALARVGWFTIWSSVEDVTVRFGGPRVGKTLEMACRVLEAPGAVIATSTRKDLVQLTSTVRATKGPVRIFNPSGLGDLPSDVTFDPIAGCADPATAAARAQDLLSGAQAPGRGGDMQFWHDQAQRVLTPLLHAAALNGGSMRDVQAWVADPEHSASEVERLLRRSQEPTFEVDAAQFFATNERTRSSISATIMPALRWLSDSSAAKAASGGGSFDVAELVAERGTVYLLGREDAQVAPLVAALTGHIARQARQLAAAQPGGRLDPPLTLALDEAAVICPVPLDSWTADFGGWGMPIHISAQSRAQLRQRWGDDGAATILNNSATLIVFGKMKDTDDLQAFSALAGERYEDVPTIGEHGPMRHRVPVLPVSRLASLPPGRVAIFRGDMPVCLGEVPIATKHPAVRALARQHRWAQFRTWLARVTSSMRTRSAEATATVRPKAKAAADRLRSYRSGRDRAPSWLRDRHASRGPAHTEDKAHESDTADRGTDRDEVSH